MMVILTKGTRLPALETASSFYPQRTYNLSETIAKIPSAGHYAEPRSPTSDWSYALAFAAAELCNVNSCSLNQLLGTSRSFDVGQLISNDLNQLIVVTKNHKTY